MGRLFGTDGIRGRANADLTPELAMAVAVAAAHTLAERDRSHPPVALLARKLAHASVEQPGALRSRLLSISSMGGREITVGYADPRAPYFGRMVLRENGKTREVLIGRSTYVDSHAGVRIVDWRDAPVSLYTFDLESGTGQFLQQVILRGSRKLNWDALTEIDESADRAGATSQTRQGG